MKLLLCFDGGSSSLKFAGYRLGESCEQLVRTISTNAPSNNDAEAGLDEVLYQLRPQSEGDVAAVGHRLVFGGPQYVAPVLADDEVLADLENLVALEPLHLRAELDLVYAARRRLPNATHVLCFDTAFHRRSPAIAKRLPLPRDVDPLLERYGFHGLSYEYIVSQLDANAGRAVIAHLGSGASLCAIRDGMPIDTTMGFSVLGGLMMGTRPGDLDPGVLLHLLGQGKYDLGRLTDLLYRRSGLLGVSGSTGDMRELLAKAPSDAAARDAIELFIYQLVKHIGAMIAVLGGLDTLVFTGGIGEHAPSVRALACRPFEYLGLVLDEEANGRGDRVISRPASRIAAMVIPTDENLMVAQHTLAVLKKAETHV